LVLYLIITNIAFSLSQDQEYSVFERMFEYVKGLKKMKRIAVAGADNLSSLETFRKLKDLGIADFILIGPIERIDKIAQENNIDISDFEIIDKKKRC
jgi:phosphotransacetylase